MVDPSLRAAAYHRWLDRSLECFQHIRQLFNGLGYNVGYGEWKDIPILRVGQRGKKRARTNERKACSKAPPELTGDGLMYGVGTD